MKTAICYYSRHHGNTLKVLQAMADVGDIDLIDVTKQKAALARPTGAGGFSPGCIGCI